MKKFGLLSSSAMGSAALFGISLIATPAYAQDNNCTPEQAAAGTCTLPPAAAQARTPRKLRARPSY